MNRGSKSQLEETIALAVGQIDENPSWITIKFAYEDERVGPAKT